ncbi:MAG TPA: glycosyltransferase family 2 protein [Candidatus Bathyarchaeia archaeon]|nr:glycosyltransferase family 2 protein [Candidatus Bathyarchaeia archaeon]
MSTLARLSSLSASFPAHNEEQNVVPMISDLLAALPEVADRFEVIVVDDGSGDATYERAAEIAARDARVRVVRHEVNRGYGAAVWSGLQAGAMDYAFFTDGDRQFDVRQIRTLLPWIAQYDVVVGYRLNRQDNLLRIANAHAWNWLIRLLLHVPVRDVDCAFKLFRRRALAGIEPEAQGAMFSAELLARIVARGARIKEVPVNHLPRQVGTSSGGNPRVIARAFYELFRLYRKLATEEVKRPRPQPIL